jgi:hypothetical protein
VAPGLVETEGAAEMVTRMAESDGIDRETARAGIIESAGSHSASQVGREMSLNWWPFSSQIAPPTSPAQSTSSTAAAHGRSEHKAVGSTRCTAVSTS